jgi:hypothetical protein
LKEIKGQIFVLLAIWSSSCGNSSEEPSSLQQFFSNSYVRRDPTLYEASLVLRIETGCTAFLAENAADKAFVVTAKHCFNSDILDWCLGKGGFQDNGHTRKCLRVIAWDPGFDIVMFEALMPKTLEKMRTLQLAAYQPEVGTKLLMIGYPADKYRQGKLSVTENCWILKKKSPSPWGIGEFGDMSSKHNCTTYGGNSGGPMIQAGTRIAVGLPFTYYPDYYDLLNSSDLGTAADMAQMLGFVQRHRATLVKEGITIQDSNPEKVGSS